MKRLDERVKQYDAEIEKLCNTNYQSFVNTFNELLNVREDTVQLKVTTHFICLSIKRGKYKKKLILHQGPTDQE